MQQTNSVASQNRIGNLILSQEPIEDYNDFMNRSLSEGGAYSIDILKKGGDFSHPQKQLTLTSVLESHPHSPDSKHQMIPQNQFTSASASSKKETARYMFTRKVSQKNAYSNLMQYFHMKRFINRIIWKKKINSIFNSYHFNVISDKASSFNLKLFKEHSLKFKMTPNLVKRDDVPQDAFCERLLKRTGKWCSDAYQKLDQGISKVPLFYPESKFKIIFDCIVLFARFYFMFVIPLDLSFSKSQILYKDWFGMTVYMMILLLIDLLVSFNTAYYESGQMVTNRCRIAAYNVSKSLGMEWVSVLLIAIFMAIFASDQSYEVNLTHKSYQLVLLVFFVQFKNITKLIRQVEGALNLSKPTRSMLELFKLIAAFMFVLHFFACLWFWAGDYSSQQWQMSWLESKQLLQKPWEQQYLYSFYFSTVTMFTVGFGDITPQSDLELLVAIGFMMICSIQLSYSVNTVGAIIAQVFAYEDEKLKRLQTINQYMQSKKISYGLQFQRIREYLNYFWSSQNEEDSQEEKQIIEQLSESLREKLMVEANSQILNTCPLFKECFSHPLKRRLVKEFKQVIVQPESTVNFDQVYPDLPGEVYITFIESGDIQIFIENDQSQLNNNNNTNEVSIVYSLKQGASLGISSFLTGKRTPERYRSVGFAKLLVLSRRDFLRTIADFPEDYEQFRHLQDNLIFNQGLDFLKMHCFSCNSLSHKALDCQMLHYVADRELVIKKVQFSQNQIRTHRISNQKRKKSCFQPRLDLDVLKEAADCFQNEHWKWLTFYEEEEEVKDIPQPTIQISQDEPAIIIDVDRRNKNSYMQRQKTRQYNSTLQVTNSNEGETLPTIQEEFGAINKRQKKSVQFSDDDSQLKTLRNKFQKAVRLVKLGNSFKKKRVGKSTARQFIESSQIQQQQVQQQNLMTAMLAQLQTKFKKIQQQPKKIKMHPNDRVMIELLILRLQMLTRDRKLDLMDQFDSLKSYKFYFVQNNLEAVLTKQEEYYSIQQELVPDLPQIFTRFSQYLMFPQDFIEKYKYAEVLLVDQQPPLLEKPPDEEELDTVKDESKSLKDTRRKTMKKNLRKSQVRPLSEGAMRSGNSLK